MTRTQWLQWKIYNNFPYNPLEVQKLFQNTIIDHVFVMSGFSYLTAGSCLEISAVSAAIGDYWMIGPGSENRGEPLKGRGGAERKNQSLCY